jgi:hypothetical protein
MIPSVDLNLLIVFDAIMQDRSLTRDCGDTKRIPYSARYVRYSNGPNGWFATC